MLSFKEVRLLLGACALLAVVNLIYLNRNDHMSTFRPSMEKVVEDEQLVGSMATKYYHSYFHDGNNDFLVVAKGLESQKDSAEMAGIVKEHASGLDKKLTLSEIEAYDYSKTRKIYNEFQPHNSKNYNRFRDKFRFFFADIFKKAKEASPDPSAKLQNNEHYNEAQSENKFPNRNGRIPVYGGHWRESYRNEPIRTKEYLSYFLRPTKADLESIQEAHKKYYLLMPETFPDDLVESGKDLNFLNGDGIVYLGGGKYNQLVLLSVAMLRRAGSRLPVEVILPKRDDFDLDFCNDVLPALNGRCKVMEDFLPSGMIGEILGFQLKNVALLVSSFQNVLYLDADNIPVKNPDYLFVNEPFKSKRLVFWPDLWRRSTSPHFYDVAGIDVDETHIMRNSFFNALSKRESESSKQYSFHDTKGAIPDASSETGQMMIDKKKHFKTLLLAWFYNYHGPDYFYPLLSQGAAGEGDKETFIAAAHKLGLSYYQVNEFNREFGPINSAKKHEFFGMGQYDPIVDYEQLKLGEKARGVPGLFAADENDAQHNNYLFHYYKLHSLMFLHANWPKFYLEELFVKNSNGRGPKDANGRRRRLYTGTLIDEADQVDFELEIMRQAKEWFCESRVRLTQLPEPETDARRHMCTMIDEQIRFMA